MKSRPSWRQFLYISLSLCFILSLITPVLVSAGAPLAPPTTPIDSKRIFTERLDWFEKVEMLTGIPWYYLAAIDQYERSMAIARKRPAKSGLTAIWIEESKWAGLLNPNPEDTNPTSITLFNGIGKDGSGDGIADRNNDDDLLAAMISMISKHGLQIDHLRIGLWDYYQNTRSVKRIDQFASIYKTYGKLDLHEYAFPLPIRAEYSYRSTWGASRGWGGFRTHEGTDLFARYGVPVRSTCYGIIEIKGWNPYGGWRIGIRDLNNVYHYYAHLSSFEKSVKEGDMVKPGQTIGWVGSSGYGKPGTSGKFPPHLHYGLYRDSGLSEWSFDPYNYLRKWEREESLRAKQK